MRSIVFLALLSVALLLACARPPVTPDALASFIDRRATADTFAGTIQVRRHDTLLYTRSFGEAERTFRIPNNRDTRYRIASITKAFTGVLIAQLMQQGRLTPTTTIGAVLPDYTGPARDMVTVEQLLHHVSGLTNMDAGLTMESALANGIPAYQRPWTLAQLVRQFASGLLVHPPGSTFDYNNADYLILGAIIERLYGKSYEVVLREQILDPLGMTSSGVALQRQITPGLAATYFYRDDIKQMVPDIPVYPENWHAAGAMFATADDLMRFATGLFGGTLLTPEWQTRYLAPGLDDYAYGFWSFTRELGGQTYHVMKRPGRIMGAQTQFYHMIEPGLTVVILTNATRIDLDQLVADIAERALHPSRP